MKQTVVYTQGGLGFFGLLGVVLITLKLLGVITWSWWWVLAPFWGPYAVFAGMMFVFCVVGLALFGRLRS